MRAEARFVADRWPGGEQQRLPVAVRRGARELEEPLRRAAQEAPQGRRAGRIWGSLRPKSALKSYGCSLSAGDADKFLLQLKEERVEERARAIRDGHMADPDVPRSLSEAITLVGTCHDMCPEYERVTRVVQNDVWNAEMVRWLWIVH
jgi:hypothetical protein